MVEEETTPVKRTLVDYVTNNGLRVFSSINQSSGILIKSGSPYFRHKVGVSLCSQVSGSVFAILLTTCK